MSNFQIVGSGNPIPSSTLVAVDNLTIFGDGSGQNPLTTGGNAQQIIPIPFGSGTNLVVGMPAVLTANGSGGIVHSAARAGINNTPQAQVLGVVTLNSDGDLQLQAGGVVTLTAAQWDARIEGGISSTGLTPGAVYYVGATAGNITTGVPAPGEAGVASTTSSPIGARIGYALTATELLMQPSVAPNTLNLPNGGGVTLGMAVAANGTGQAIPAQANAAATAAVLGVAGYIDTNNNVIIFTDGMILDLTVAQWDAVTGGGAGLVEGATYYLSAAAGGDLVEPTPTATAGDFAVLVGVGLSTTKLSIRLGAPGYAHP